MGAASAKNDQSKAGRSGRALIVLVVLAVGSLLYWAREVFVPVTLALLFSMILSSVVEVLRRWGVPRTVGASLVLAVILSGVAAVVDVLIEPAHAWFIGAPQILKVIERKIRPIETIIHRVQSMTAQAQPTGAPASGRPTPTEPPLSTATLMSATGSTLASAMTVVLLTLFLLSRGPPMLARMTASSPRIFEPRTCSTS